MTRKTHFGVFKPHTLTKHAILDAYLKAWATILVPRFGAVWFVDAFAGEGRDDVGHPGSPLIAAKVAEQINAKHFPAGITRHKGMRLIAFEAEHDRFLSLDKVMSAYVAEPWHQGTALVREGTLEEKLEPVLKTLENAPTLFFLDPFGIDGLSAAVLPSLLAPPQNELLILFSDEGAVRLAGKVRAGRPDANAMISRAEGSVPDSLFGREETEALRAEKRTEAKRSAAGHKSNEDAERILDTAFGGGWWRTIIDGTPDELRQAKFVELYEAMLERFGASHRLRFSIDTPDGRHKYFLIHASKNKRAYAAMKDAMHRARKTKAESAIAPSLLDHLITDTNVEDVATTIARQFAGKRVRWQGEHPSVRGFAIDDTPLWYHELEALKAELLRRGYTELNERGKPKSPLAFNFASV
jgi:three-Cys-motif partner protein